MSKTPEPVIASKSSRDQRETIDVTVATLNSGSTIEKCLQSIFANVPVRELIVVDGGSADRTVQITGKYPVRVIEEKGLLGRTRYVQALNCKTNWIAYFDSDVYVYKNWWEDVSAHVDQQTGMVLGFADAPVNRLPIYDRYLKHRAKVEGAVAFTNTLVRRHLVLECREILRRVHAGEDDAIARHIRERGFRIVTIPRRLCYHDKDPFLTHSRAYYRSGKSARIRYGYRGSMIVLNALRSNISAWWRFSRQTGAYSGRLLIFLVKLWINYVAGFLS
jgi:glycosyltransferase involved in cell wall biosynthesis